MKKLICSSPVLACLMSPNAGANAIPDAPQISNAFYTLQLRGTGFQLNGQQAEVFIYDRTFDQAAFGTINIVNANTQQSVFSRTYGDYGNFNVSGTFSESLLLPYSTPLNISMNGQEFSAMYLILGSQAVASGGSFNGQFPSYSTTLTIAPPVPVANNDSYSTIKGQAVALNVLANDTDVYQLDGYSSPANGTLVQGNQGITYVPAANFVGTDSFTYTVRNFIGVQATASVTVLVADGTLIDAGQTGDQRTLVDVVEDILLTNSASPALIQRAEGISLLLEQPGGVQKVEQALQNLAPEETVTQGISSNRLSRIQVNNINQRLTELRGGAKGISLKGLSLNLNGQNMPTSALASLAPYQAKGGSAGDDDLFQRLGLFVNGQFETGERTNTSLDPGYRSKIYGLSMGADYWLSQKLLLGISAGYGYTDSKLSGNASSLDIDGYSVSGFGAFHFNDSLFIDFIANATINQYKSLRNIAYTDAFGPVNEQAKANVQGIQQRYSSTTGYDIPWGGWVFGLRARGEYSRLGIDAYREQGAGALNLAIGEQAIVSVTSGLGGIINYALSTPFGVISPQVNLEWEHEYDKNARQIFASFVEDRSGNTFSVRTGSPDRDYLNLRTALSATLPHGGSAFVQYETVLSLLNESRHTFNAGIRMAF